jgi:hypothetical protein
MIAAEFTSFDAPQLAAQLNCMSDAELDALDETIDYTFSLHMKPMPVTLRMLKPAYNERMYLLVTWS